MADEQRVNRDNFIVGATGGTVASVGGGTNGEPLNIVAEGVTPAHANNIRHGTIHDRLFQTLLVKMALSYSQHVSYRCRRLIEFFTLLVALSLFGFLIYVHVVFNRFPGTCLNQIREIWPRKGVLRVEVIHNLEYAYYVQNSKNELGVCAYNLRKVLMEGPKSLPFELRKNLNFPNQEHIKIDIWNGNGYSPFQGQEPPIMHSYFADSLLVKAIKQLVAIIYGPFEWLDENDEEETLESVYNNSETIAETLEPMNELHLLPAYIVEYSLFYGLLKLSPIMRREYGVPVMVVQLDADADQCFGDWHNRFLIHHFVGFEEVIMSSLRWLAENDTDKGYLRDMMSGEHYQFVTSESSRYTYLNALGVMLVFTFAISMLLRFSHHQIFLFIIDLLQMFDLNQPLVFPVAPLLTVILALVGMEAIMSEIFNDTSTAFYMILLVWIADQYDAICCQSSISKRHWLKFFYLYHYAFYAYHYRYNGSYSGLALLTSSAFILHSMVFFLHHYELPLIIYQEQLRQVVSDLQHHTINGSARLNVTVTLVEDSPNTTDQLANISNLSAGRESSAQNVNSPGETATASSGLTNVTCTIRQFLSRGFSGRRLITQRLLLRNSSVVVPPTANQPPSSSSTENQSSQEAEILRRVGGETADRLLNDTMNAIFPAEGTAESI